MFGKSKDKQELEAMRERMAQIRVLVWPDEIAVWRDQQPPKLNPEKNEYVREVMREEKEIRGKKKQHPTFEQWLLKNCKNGCHLCKICRKELEEVIKYDK